MQNSHLPCAILTEFPSDELQSTKDKQTKFANHQESSHHFLMGVSGQGQGGSRRNTDKLDIVQEKRGWENKTTQGHRVME